MLGHRNKEANKFTFHAAESFNLHFAPPSHRPSSQKGQGHHTIDSLGERGTESTQQSFLKGDQHRNCFSKTNTGTVSVRPTSALFQRQY